jgi:hypothetical protein
MTSQGRNDAANPTSTDAFCPIMINRRVSASCFDEDVGRRDPQRILNSGKNANA